MEKEDGGSNSTSHNAISCAKAAMLLSSLHTRIRLQEKEVMKQTMEELKMEIIRERFKRKKLKLCNLLEFTIQIVLLFSLLTFFFLRTFACAEDLKMN